jgi:hypothetical protein
MLYCEELPEVSNIAEAYEEIGALQFLPKR